MFDYKSFEEILSEIKSFNYNFLRFDENSRQGNIIYLRHDVDISPRAAKVLAEIEHSLGIKSNFFFQIDTDTYNIFSLESLSIIKQLRSFGHLVGLHINELLLDPAPQKIYPTLKWFNECITAIDFAISYHRPSLSVLNEENGLFLSSYQNRFFSPETYLSDSRRNADFYPQLVAYLRDGRSPLQLLLHPCWWYPEQDPVKFKNILIRRRKLELKSYLNKNFPKYMGGEDEDCVIGL